MSSKTKPNYFAIALVVVAGVILLTAILFAVTGKVLDISRALYAPSDTERQQVVEARIRPVGQVAIAGMDAAESGTPADVTEPAPADEAVATAEEAADELGGEAVYRAACTACHGAGIAGAPRTGDRGEWAERLAQGVDVLVEHAITGFQGEAGFMPARGGHANLTDGQVRAAVQYMVDTIDN